MPTGLTTIEESAFEGMMNMTVVDAGNCRSIGAGAFKNSGIEQILLPADCDIDATAFEGCGRVFVFAPAGDKTQQYCNQDSNPCVFVQTN